MKQPNSKQLLEQLKDELNRIYREAQSLRYREKCERLKEYRRKLHVYRRQEELNRWWR